MSNPRKDAKQAAKFVLIWFLICALIAGGTALVARLTVAVTDDPPPNYPSLAALP